MAFLYVICTFLLAYMVGFFFLIIDPTITQGAALALAGALTVPITQALKKVSGLSKGAAFLTSLAIAGALSVAAVFFTGQYAGVKDLIASATIVFTIAQAVFKVVVADSPADKPLTPNDLH